jgi:hypothetical protein
MTTYTGFEAFTNNYFPPIIFVIGFIGNAFGMIVLARKQMQAKLYMTHIYMYLLISDMVYLVTQLPLSNIHQSYPSVNPMSDSSWFCKFWFFTDYGLANTSPMILLYISIERFVAVKFPSKRFILRKHTAVVLFTIGITVINLIFYIPVYLDYFIDVTFVNGTNQTVQSCNISGEDNEVISWMFLVFNCIIVYILMIFCTLWLCYTIFQSRSRTEANRNIRKDIRFTLTSISLNVAFIALTFPISISNFATSMFYDSIFQFCNLLFYSSYTVNFYFLFAFNKIIREEVYSFLRINKIKRESSNPSLRPTTGNRNAELGRI